MARRSSNRFSRLVLPLISLGVLGYFSYHTVQGNHGWRSWKILQKDLATAQAELSTLESKKNRLQNKVALLRAETLDHDMLDERVRAMLGTVQKGEIVILEGQS